MAHLFMKQAAVRRRTAGRLAGAAITLALAACGGGGGGDPIEIRTLSNRADLVSGGDVLTEVKLPSGAAGGQLRITAGGRDVTAAFARMGEGRLVGLVSGLPTGTTVLRASAEDAAAAVLRVTNHPGSGPVLSGAQVNPFYCATATPQPASGNTPATNGSGLSGTADAHCSIPSETRLYYRTTAAAGPGGCTPGMPDPPWNTSPTATVVPPQPAPAPDNCWKPYTVGSQPADLAQASTDSGATVPFIVRVERGTINRGIYDIAVLFDPGRGWEPTAPQAGWNGKVYYQFGFSTGQPRRQSRPTVAWSSTEEQLRRGYLVAGNSMSDSPRNSNRVLMSETVMMMKEHIADRYGPIRWTLGTGCSGGSINANTTASIMPGLLDGIVSFCTYPDAETTTMEVADCTLLVEAYRKPQLLNLWQGLGLTQAQINARKGAINGHPDQSACHAWFNAFGSNAKAGLFFQRLVADNDSGAIFQAPTASNNCELPNSAVYDPANPVATANLPRCDAWSWAESIWGKVPGSQAARDTRDNVGVQYGLKALRDGAITAEEFVTLNETVGGTDRDSTARAARSTADVAALEIAYRAGIVSSGRQLAKTAIIDLRGWDDSNITVPPGTAVSQAPIHHQWFSFALRDRLVREAGDAGNQALWRFARGGLLPPARLAGEAFLAMDHWLTELVTSPATAPLAQRVRAARPTSGAFDTRDFCLLTGDAAQDTRVRDQARCDADPFLKPSLSPRQVAGGPRSEDVLKCQRKPLAQSDYAAGTFTPDQWNRLLALFSGGVCDWSRPGVGQQPAESPLTFRNGPGGEPLPPEPVSGRP